MSTEKRKALLTLLVWTRSDDRGKEGWLKGWLQTFFVVVVAPHVDFIALNQSPQQTQNQTDITYKRVQILFKLEQYRVIVSGMVCLDSVDAWGWIWGDGGWNEPEARSSGPMLTR